MVKKNDIVIVSFHGGAEGLQALHVPEGPEMFLDDNRGDLRAFAHAVIDAGASLVLGHGPHVPRAMEMYNHHLVAYSLGNFATYKNFSLQGYEGVGLILEVTLGGDGRFVSGKIIPTRQKGYGIPIEDPKGAATDLVRLLSSQDFPKTGVRVGNDGTISERE